MHVDSLSKQWLNAVFYYGLQAFLYAESLNVCGSVLILQFKPPIVYRIRDVGLYKGPVMELCVYPYFLVVNFLIPQKFDCSLYFSYFHFMPVALVLYSFIPIYILKFAVQFIFVIIHLKNSAHFIKSPLQTIHLCTGLPTFYSRGLQFKSGYAFLQFLHNFPTIYFCGLK